MKLAFKEFVTIIRGENNDSFYSSLQSSSTF